MILSNRSGHVFKKCTDRSESVIYDQEMFQSVQFSHFQLDRWTSSLFTEELKNYKFRAHGQLFGVKFFKQLSDRCESVIYDQEMFQSAQFSDFKLDR